MNTFSFTDPLSAALTAFLQRLTSAKSPSEISAAHEAARAEIEGLAAKEDWLIAGPSGPVFDSVIAGFAAVRGYEVRAITPRAEYLVRAPKSERLPVAAVVSTMGLSLGTAAARPAAVRLTTYTAQPSKEKCRRILTLSGGDARPHVARAVDRGLHVGHEAVGDRWTVTGRTADLVQWLAQIQRKTPAEVMAEQGWTPASVAEDDGTPLPAPPVEVKVELPTRVTTSDITHDRDGLITKVVQTEVSEGGK